MCKERRVREKYGNRHESSKNKHYLNLIKTEIQAAICISVGNYLFTFRVSNSVEFCRIDKKAGCQPMPSPPLPPPSPPFQKRKGRWQKRKAKEKDKKDKVWYSSSSSSSFVLFCQGGKGNRRKRKFSLVVLSCVKWERWSLRIYFSCVSLEILLGGLQTYAIRICWQVNSERDQVPYNMLTCT